MRLFLMAYLLEGIVLHWVLYWLQSSAALLRSARNFSGIFKKRCHISNLQIVLWGPDTPRDTVWNADIIVRETLYDAESSTIGVWTRIYLDKWSRFMYVKIGPLLSSASDIKRIPQEAQHIPHESKYLISLLMAIDIMMCNQSVFFDIHLFVF